MMNWANIISAVRTPIGLFALVILVVGVAIGAAAVNKIENDLFLTIVIVCCLAFLGFGLYLFARYVIPNQSGEVAINPIRVLMGGLAHEIHDALEDYLAAESLVEEAESWAQLLYYIGRQKDGEDAYVAGIRASLANQLYERVVLNSPNLEAEIKSFLGVNISFPIKTAQ